MLAGGVLGGRERMPSKRVRRAHGHRGLRAGVTALAALRKDLYGMYGMCGKRFVTRKALEPQMRGRVTWH